MRGEAGEAEAEGGEASMRPRGQTPRMPQAGMALRNARLLGFNEAAGADPADACMTAPTCPAVRSSLQ